MKTQIINGRKIKEDILNKLKKEVELLPFPPVFCDILVGDDPVSSSYVDIKCRTAQSIGIKFKIVNFPKTITTREIIEEINNLNNVPHICGIIVQLPLPDHIDSKEVLDAIKPELDVDCLGSYNSDMFYNSSGDISYPTVMACIKIIESLNLDLKNKNIVVVGQGKLVGMPVAHLLKSKSLDVHTINSRTENADFILKNADIVISAVGRGKFITGDMIKEGVIIIDAGTSEENGAVVGDVDEETVVGKASFLTKTPGGVGPVTVAMLLSNVLKVAKKFRV